MAGELESSWCVKDFDPSHGEVSFIPQRGFLNEAMWQSLKEDSVARRVAGQMGRQVTERVAFSEVLRR